MPTINSASIQSGTGKLTFGTPGNGPSGGGGSTTAPITFTVVNPASGISLSSGASVSGNNITLNMNSLAAGANITLSNTNGVILISSTGILPPSGVTAGAYTSSNITVNAQGLITAAANGSGGGGSGSVTSIIAGTGLSGGTITMTGTIALATTAVTPGTYTIPSITVNGEGQLTAASNQTIVYGDLPSQIQNQLVTVTLPGRPGNDSNCLIVPITQNTQIPANFAGSIGYCGTPATGSPVFTASYVHSGTPHSIGGITFAASATTATLPTFSLISLVPGDIFFLQTPVSADDSLADVGITLVFLKQ